MANCLATKYRTFGIAEARHENVRIAASPSARCPSSSIRSDSLNFRALTSPTSSAFPQCRDRLLIAAEHHERETVEIASRFVGAHVVHPLIVAQHEVGYRHARANQLVETACLLVCRARGFEQTAISAGVHQPREQLWIGGPRLRPLEQAGHRVLGSAEIDLEMRIEVVRH